MYIKFVSHLKFEEVSTADLNPYIALCDVWTEASFSFVAMLLSLGQVRINTPTRNSADPILKTMFSFGDDADCFYCWTYWNRLIKFTRYWGTRTYCKPIFKTIDIADKRVNYCRTKSLTYMVFLSPRGLAHSWSGGRSDHNCITFWKLGIYWKNIQLNISVIFLLNYID